MKKWSDTKSFCFETSRMILVIMIGYFAVVTIVHPSEKVAEENLFIVKEKMIIKKEVVDDFIQTSYSYASSVYKVMSNDTDLDIKKEEELYEFSYRAYRVDLNRMLLYFNIEDNTAHQTLVNKSNDIRYKLRQIYLNKSDEMGWEKLRDDFKVVNNEIAKYALRSLGL